VVEKKNNTTNFHCEYHFFEKYHQMTIFCTLSISNIFVNTSGSDLYVLLSPAECEGEGVFGQG
jgi:hypothetical protein